jgi:hypothetical protein
LRTRAFFRVSLSVILPPLDFLPIVRASRLSTMVAIR